MTVTPEACATVTDIEGVYACTGQCVGADLSATPATFQERDRIAAVPGTTALFQVSIEGDGGFTETEIGALAGTTLRTATSAVSDNVFPVLEEYVFETEASCRASGYTKIVRGPSQGNFKACAVSCRRS